MTVYDNIAFGLRRQFGDQEAGKTKFTQWSENLLVGLTRKLPKKLRYISPKERIVAEQVEKVAAAVAHREANFQEDWMIIITTDHGRDSISGKDHGGQSDRERTTWIISNKKLGNDFTKTSTPAVVDIFPTLARHLQLQLPEWVERELDGQSLIGPLSVSDLSAVKSGKEIELNWKSHNSEKLQLFAAPSDDPFHESSSQYSKIKSVQSAKGKMSFEDSFGSPWVRIVLKGRNNSANVWLKTK
jgi:hypothetical protein